MSRLSPHYRSVMNLAYAPVKLWGRLEVVGLEQLPESGPTLAIGNHDSYWDPVVVGVAARKRRQIQALAKSTLWKNKAMAWVVDGMGQIPVHRGEGNAAALATATEMLRAGACIGVFPEGTISRGAWLRPRSGAGWLAQAVPEATIVLATVTGTVDLVRFPKRPRIRVEFFRPETGGVRADETPAELIERLMKEVRDRAPVVIPGRRKTATKYRERIEAGLPPKQ